MVDEFYDLDRCFREFLTCGSSRKKAIPYLAALLYPWAHRVWSLASNEKVEAIIQEAAPLLAAHDIFSSMVTDGHGTEYFEDDKKRRGPLVAAICMIAMDFAPNSRTTGGGSWSMATAMRYVCALMESPLWPIISKCGKPDERIESEYLNRDKSTVLFRCITANSPLPIRKTVLKPKDKYYSKIERWFFCYSTQRVLYVRERF